MAKKTQFLIVHGASVVVVRDGKRKTLNPGQGENFTEEEILAVNNAAPGSLRAPINEGSGRKSRVEDDADDADDEDDADVGDDGDDGDDDEEVVEEKPKAKASAKKSSNAKKAKKPASEDEDI